MSISILIPTKNEQQDLPGCLAWVNWSDDIHVYDSYSTDNTENIAKSFGASFIQRPSHHDKTALFGGNEAEHKNWAMQNINFKYPWVLHLDADERLTSELIENIKKAVQNPGDNIAFRIQRRDFFMDTWLKHVQTSPYYLRLFRPEKMHYERLINPTSIPDGPVGIVSGYLDHYPFSKGISHWINRHNNYSSLEAEQIFTNRNETFSFIKAFTAKDFHQRRFHQKELFYRLPFRPFIKFLLLYILKRGFLDGQAGYTYARLQAFYEYMIVLKTQELEYGKKTCES